MKLEKKFFFPELFPVTHDSIRRFDCEARGFDCEAGEKKKNDRKKQGGGFVVFNRCKPGLGLLGFRMSLLGLCVSRVRSVGSK